MHNRINGDTFRSHDAGKVLVINDFQQTSTVDLSDVFLYTQIIKEHRSNDIFFIYTSQGSDGIKVIGAFLQQDILGSTVSMDNIEIRKFLTEKVCPLAVGFNDFELDFTILENIEQVVGNLSCSDNHQALNNSRTHHIVELNDVQAVTCDIDLVAGIQSEITVRDF